ncbi:MAG: hypothetical protein BMS9Abin15_0124 [Gammaproteobacteria bacterium]|nr:MAG: hypothetical protein BMS9Abin15_0124 [Gammaproteobacteria bacterium]
MLFGHSMVRNIIWSLVIILGLMTAGCEQAQDQAPEPVAEVGEQHPETKAVPAEPQDGGTTEGIEDAPKPSCPAGEGMIGGSCEQLNESGTCTDDDGNVQATVICKKWYCTCSGPDTAAHREGGATKCEECPRGTTINPPYAFPGVLPEL